MKRFAIIIFIVALLLSLVACGNSDDERFEQAQREEKAYQSGYENGSEEGYLEGYKDGEQEGRNKTCKIARSYLSDIEIAVNHLDEYIPEKELNELYNLIYNAQRDLDN